MCEISKNDIYDLCCVGHTRHERYTRQERYPGVDWIPRCELDRRYTWGNRLARKASYIPGIPGARGLPGKEGDSGARDLPGKMGKPALPGWMGLPGKRMCVEMQWYFISFSEGMCA